MIELQGVSLVYNKNSPLKKTVLDDINLTVEDDSLVGIIGANGAGKSTFVKLISGDITPTSGKIIIDGVNCTNFDAVRRSNFIAKVFQDPRKGTACNLSILENLIFANKRGKKRTISWAYNGNYRSFFAEKLSKLNMGLENRLDQKVGSLSGGQRQALSLIMATLQLPKLLILDEHTAALDPKAADIVMELTHRIVTTHCLTALMITHNMEQIEYCSHLLRISDGKTYKERLYS